MRPKSELSELVDSVWDEVGIAQNMCETLKTLYFQTILGSQLCLEDIKVMKHEIHTPEMECEMNLRCFSKCWTMWG